MLIVTPGNINDMNVAPTLIERAGSFNRLVADRGYDTNRIRALLAARGAEAVIPSTTTRRQPIPYDREAYRSRNLVERIWCRLRDWRRIATRYDKLAANYLAAALIAACFTFWGQLSPEPRPSVPTPQSVLEPGPAETSPRRPAPARRSSPLSAADRSSGPC